MISLRAIRGDLHFADLFAHVYVICWPILWWQLNLLRKWCLAHNIPDVLYSVSPWGFIKVRQFGKAPDPNAYTPRPRTFRPLTDDSWASALPTNLEGLSPFDEAIKLTDGPVLRSLQRSRKEAPPSPQNTS